MVKKKRSAKQKANDKRLGRMAKARAKIRTGVKNRVSKAQVKRTVNRVNRKRNTRKAFKRVKRRSSVKSMKSMLGSSTLKKVALGVGGGVLAGTLLSYVTPNSSFAKFAAPAGAYALGGIEGVIGQLALGMVTAPTGSNTNVAPRMEAL